MRFAFGRRPLFTAWVSEFGFALAERVTDEKSNEITALPKILDELGASIAECVVTIDAAGCQKAAVSHLRSSGHSLETHSGDTPGVDRLSFA